MFDSLETDRLLLRPVELADAPRTQLLFPQWEVVKFLNARVPWPYPPDGVLNHYRNVILPNIARGEEWHWTLRLKSTPQEHIGAISVIHGAENRGFWLGLPWHGQGLMTEAVRAVNDFWFDTLGFDVLRTSKAILNTGSRRISEKTGMRVIATEERDCVSGRFPAEVWEITAAEWRTHRALIK